MGRSGCVGGIYDDEIVIIDNSIAIYRGCGMQEDGSLLEVVGDVARHTIAITDIEYTVSVGGDIGRGGDRTVVVGGLVDDGIDSCLPKTIGKL